MNNPDSPYIVELTYKSQLDLDKSFGELRPINSADFQTLAQTLGIQTRNLLDYLTYNLQLPILMFGSTDIDVHDLNNSQMLHPYCDYIELGIAQGLRKHESLPMYRSRVIIPTVVNGEFDVLRAFDTDVMYISTSLNGSPVEFGLTVIDNELWITTANIAGVLTEKDMIVYVRYRDVNGECFKMPAFVLSHSISLRMGLIGNPVCFAARKLNLLETPFLQKKVLEVFANAQKL